MEWGGIEWVLAKAVLASVSVTVLSEESCTDLASPSSDESTTGKAWMLGMRFGHARLTTICQRLLNLWTAFRDLWAELRDPRAECELARELRLVREAASTLCLRLPEYAQLDQF